MLDDPASGGSIQHVADCFDQYLRRKDADPDTLIDYVDRLGNGAVFKRIDFLAERHPQENALTDAAKSRLTRGYAKLDPALECMHRRTRVDCKTTRRYAQLANAPTPATGSRARA